MTADRLLSDQAMAIAASRWPPGHYRRRYRHLLRKCYRDILISRDVLEDERAAFANGWALASRLPPVSAAVFAVDFSQLYEIMEQIYPKPPNHSWLDFDLMRE